jgi:uncharacterized membrane protein YphA (DoxX/SURF4 family)
MKSIVIISRILVGSLFIVSGLIKANDALGFEYKLLEYFSEKALDMEFLIPFALPVAIIICISEILLGAALLLNALPKLTNALMLVMILFFTWLTYYTASCDPFQKQTFVNEQGQEYIDNPECVLECGCFGNAIPLTPWESFTKDVVLLFFIIITFLGTYVFGYTKINTTREDLIIVTASLTLTSLFALLMLDWLFPILFTALVLGAGLIVKRYYKGAGREWVMALGVLIVCMTFQYQTLAHLPMRDYRPYAVGEDIVYNMKTAEELGKKSPVYVTMYVLKNKTTGETIQMDSEKYLTENIWKDKNLEIADSWGPITKESGYEPLIIDFIIEDYDGNDVTMEILEGDDIVFLQVTYDLEKADLSNQPAISAFADAALADGHRFFGVTSAGYDESEEFRHQHQCKYPFLVGDEKVLKTMVRANPGIVAIKGGVVQNKWHYNDLPTYKEAKANQFQD